MASSVKTPLGFNAWLGSDIPAREDFVGDNQLSDDLLTEITTTAAEARSIADSAAIKAATSGERAEEGIRRADTAQAAADARLPFSGGAMTGQLIAQSNTSYIIAQVRNAIISDTDLTAGTSSLISGSLYFVYE